MRVPRLTALTTATAMVTAALAALGTPAQAAADGSYLLGNTGFRDIAVAGDHVFITGGGSTGVIVRTLEGAATTTITNQPGASQMAVDGNLLYVALSSGDAISAIDTTTLTEVARYATGASTCPSSVAVTAGRIWFGYGCQSAQGQVGVVDLTTEGNPVSLNRAGVNAFYDAPLLETTASLPGVLFTAASTVQKWDVTTTTLTLLAGTAQGEGARDVVITADGSHIITANGAPYYHPAYKTSDLSADGAYGTYNPYPTAVSASSSGLVAAGIDDAYDADIKTYKTDGTYVRSYDFGTCCSAGVSTSLKSRGLAFDATGARLYAVTADYLGDTVTLRVLHAPGAFPTTLTAKAPTSATRGTAFTITGSLTSSPQLPGGTKVSVVRDGPGGTVSRPSTQTITSGAFSFKDATAARGTFGYTFSYAGDSEHAASSKRIVVNVSGTTPSLSITTSAGPYTYGARPTIVAHLGTTINRTVRLYATPYGGTKTLLKVGTADSHGDVKVAYRMTRKTVFTASFAGDSVYNPRVVAKAIGARASVTVAQAGYYGTSGTYRLYHVGQTPYIVATVAPAHYGACVAFYGQRYSGGTWVNGASNSCVPTESDSRAYAYYGNNYPAGTLVRFRVTFPGSSSNASQTSGWTYGKFTR